MTLRLRVELVKYLLREAPGWKYDETLNSKGNHDILLAIVPELPSKFATPLMLGAWLKALSFVINNDKLAIEISGMTQPFLTLEYRRYGTGMEFSTNRQEE